MADEKPTRWQTFTGWHREASLWREVYARTISTLTAAFVIYLVAAASGAVSRKPLVGIATLAVVLLVVMTFWQVRKLRRLRKKMPLAFGNDLLALGREYAAETQTLRAVLVALGGPLVMSALTLLLWTLQRT